MPGVAACRAAQRVGAAAVGRWSGRERGLHRSREAWHSRHALCRRRTSKPRHLAVPLSGPGPGHVRTAGATVALSFGRGQVDLSAVRAGDLVWKNSDPALLGRLRSSYEGLAAGAQRRLPVAVAVEARLGAPLRVTLTDERVGWRAGQGTAGSVKVQRRRRCCCHTHRQAGAGMRGCSLSLSACTAAERQRAAVWSRLSLGP